MSKLIKKYLFLVIVFLCILVAFTYRSRFYWEFPPIEDNFDEFAYGWLGASLIKTGIPTSWSFIPDYEKGYKKGMVLEVKDFRIEADGIVPNRDNYKIFPKPLTLAQEFTLDGYTSHFRIVSPYLEQPPLGGIIISLPLLGKVNDFQDASVRLLRYPFVVLGTVSVLLVVWLGSLLYSRLHGIVAGIIYATAPTVILGSRLALPENILTPLILLEVILLHYYRKKEKSLFLVLALAITFIAPLIKPFGLVCALIGFGYLAIFKKDYKKGLLFVLSALGAVLVYVLYALSYDKNTFLWVLTYQSGRFFAGPSVFILKFIIPRITKVFLDGWILFGWISLFAICLSRSVKKHTELMIPIFSYLLVLLFFGGEDYGWYRFPLYPFLIVAAAIMTIKIIAKPNFFSALTFLLVAPVTGFAWGLGIYNWMGYINYFRIFLTTSIAFSAITLFSDKKIVLRLTSIFLTLIFVSSLFLNTRVINNVRAIWAQLGDRSSLIIDRQ